MRDDVHTQPSVVKNESRNDQARSWQKPLCPGTMNMSRLGTAACAAVDGRRRRRRARRRHAPRPPVFLGWARVGAGAWPAPASNKFASTPGTAAASTTGENRSRTAKHAPNRCSSKRRKR